MSCVASQTIAEATGADQPARLRRMAAFLIIALGIIRLIPAIGSVNIHNDFSHYYIGGSIYASGESAYTTPLEPLMEQRGLPFDSTIPFAAHPPLILLTMSLISRLPIEAAYFVWLTAQVLMAVFSVDLARRILGRSWADSKWLLLVGLFINSLSFQMLIYYSQVQLIVAALLYLSYWLGRNQKHGWACATITLASAFKIYPVVLAPWVFFRDLRGPRDAFQRLGAMAGMSVVCLVTPGFSNWIEFVTEGVPTLADHTVKWCNFSLQNLWPMLGRVLPTVGSIDGLLAHASSLVAVIAAYVLAYRLRCRPLASFSVVLVAVVFAGVITWSHYLTVLFLPVCFLLLRTDWNVENRSDLGFSILTVVVCVALMMPKVDCLLFPLVESTPRLLLHFYPLYAAIGLCVLLARHGQSSSQR